VGGWLGLMALFAGLMALFVLWDLLFCGGRRCRELVSRAADLLQMRTGRKPPPEERPDSRPRG